MLGLAVWWLSPRREQKAAEHRLKSSRSRIFRLIYFDLAKHSVPNGYSLTGANPVPRCNEARPDPEGAPALSGLLPPASCLLPPASCLLPPASCLLPPASCLLLPTSAIKNSLFYFFETPTAPQSEFAIGEPLPAGE